MTAPVLELKYRNTASEDIIRPEMLKAFNEGVH